MINLFHLIMERFITVYEEIPRTNHGGIEDGKRKNNRIDFENDTGGKSRTLFR